MSDEMNRDRGSVGVGDQSGEQGGLPHAPGITAPEFRSAGFWIRAAALIIDIIIINVLTMPVSRLFEPDATDVAGLEVSGYLRQAWPGILLGFLFNFLYYGFFYTKMGATPGKLALGIQVTKDGSGRYLTWGETFIRQIPGQLVSSVLLGIGYLMVAFRSDRKALHDLIVKSRVVYKKK